MFYITFSSLWSLTFFFFFTYLIFFLSSIVYLLPVILNNYKYNLIKLNFYFLNNLNFLWLIYFSLFSFFLIINLWSSPVLSIWFSHLIFTNFQLKMTFFIFIFYLMIKTVLISSFSFTSKELYDYLVTLLQFFYWIVIIFLSNTIFSMIFIIEVLSTLLFLLFITSIFSSSFFYRNIDYSFGHIFQSSLPYVYIQSILIFFWISLLSSLNLFLFLLLFYTNLLTLDLFLLEYIFIYYININSFKEIFSLGISWFILIFCIFLKCGITPFFLWKPAFFKGIPFYTIFFYICFFYFFLFLFLIYFLTSFFINVFYYYSIIMVIVILLGIITLLGIICESYYFKIFMALSSILNSLLVFLALTIPHNINVNFWL